MSDAAGGRRAWRAIAAATALDLPFGTLYAFSVFLAPLEELLGVTRADLALVFAFAAAGFGGGMNLAPALYRLAIARIHVVAGFGRIDWISSDQYRTAASVKANG